MPPALTRRALGLGTLALLAARNPAAAVTGDGIAAIERAHGGRLGVFALDTGTGRTLGHRCDERFLMQSTFKGMLAAMVLSQIDAGRDGLDRPVRYGARDLVAHSPVTGLHAAAGTMTVGALCEAILKQSDNAAANLLLARIGGPSRLTGCVRSLGDDTTRFDRYEPVGGWNGTMDTTTPRAVAGTAQTILLGRALQPDSRARLQRWMVANTVGLGRLRAAFPGAWTVADRTGTGDGICNDFAVAWHPGRAPLVMAAYYEAPGMATPLQEAALREVGAAIRNWAA